MSLQTGSSDTAKDDDGSARGIWQMGVLGILEIQRWLSMNVRARGDFLLTTIPIADFKQTAPFPIVLPQMADGGGNRIQFIQLGTSGSGNSTLNYYYGDNGSTLSLSKIALGISESWNGAADVGEVFLQEEKIKLIVE